MDTRQVFLEMGAWGLAWDEGEGLDVVKVGCMLMWFILPSLDSNM